MRTKIQDSIFQSLKNKPCTVCGKSPVDIDHFKTWGSSRDNSLSNLMPLCRQHHTMKGFRGRKFMYDNFKSYAKWCDSNGWKYCEFLNKWMHNDGDGYDDTI